MPLSKILEEKEEDEKHDTYIRVFTFNAHESRELGKEKQHFNLKTK